MKYYLILLLFSPFGVFAQALYLDGSAVLHVERGSGTSTVLYVEGDLANNGTIEDDGSVEVNGNASLTGILDFMVGGTDNGLGYSPIVAGGTASLTSGTLNVSLTNGFTPNVGDQFTVLDASNIDGIFTNMNLPILSSPKYWVVNYQPSEGLLELEVSTILQVELLDFQAFAESENDRLEWSTASEINADRFEIEHSTDGLSFGKIGSTKAVGGPSSQQSYAFLHEHPVAGVNYYRLRQFDLDGSWEYSRIVTVVRGNSQPNRVLAYPNPVSEMLFFDFPNTGDDYLLEVFDVQGRQVLTSSRQSAMRVDQLLPGEYWLKITHANSGTTAVQKLAILR